MCDYDVLLQSTMVVLRSIVRSESAVKNREFVARNAIDPLLSDIVFKNGEVIHVLRSKNDIFQKLSTVDRIAKGLCKMSHRNKCLLLLIV